jgi:hypothetical protein
LRIISLLPFSHCLYRHMHRLPFVFFTTHRPTQSHRRYWAIHSTPNQTCKSPRLAIAR